MKKARRIVLAAILAIAAILAVLPAMRGSPWFGSASGLGHEIIAADPSTDGYWLINDHGLDGETRT